MAVSDDGNVMVAGSDRDFVILGLVSDRFYCLKICMVILEVVAE